MFSIMSFQLFILILINIPFLKYFKVYVHDN